MAFNIMKAVIQRVANAEVIISNHLYSSINVGLCIFLGIKNTDTIKNVEQLVNKIIHLRIFPDSKNKMNKSILDIQGEALVISQFTLYANCKKGNRPSFNDAASKLIASPLYELFINLLKEKKIHVRTGQFGADMNIQLNNNGPVTIIVEQ